MLTCDELDKWINLADECMPTYSARRDVQAALMIAIAQLQIARIVTEEHEARQAAKSAPAVQPPFDAVAMVCQILNMPPQTVTAKPASEITAINWTPEPRK
jgi:hypothetical protein